MTEFSRDAEKALGSQFEPHTDGAELSPQPVKLNPSSPERFAKMVLETQTTIVASQVEIRDGLIRKQAIEELAAALLEVMSVADEYEHAASFRRARYLLTTYGHDTHTDGCGINVADGTCNCGALGD